MGYMNTTKFQRNQKMSYYDKQRTAAGQRVKITYQTEDGQIHEVFLHPDEKVRVISDQKKLVNSPRPSMVLKEVTQVFCSETYEWIHLILSTGEELTCTREHPFSVKGKGWVLAIDLETGDQFLTSDGKECSLSGRWIEKLDHPETTYNFEVEGCHNYFVGESGILVHNVCVAKEGKFRADVKAGGDPNHPYTGHAHIYDGSKNIASVKADGTLMAGTPKGKAADFVTNHLDEIAQGIDEYYWIGRI